MSVSVVTILIATEKIPSGGSKSARPMLRFAMKVMQRSQFTRKSLVNGRQHRNRQRARVSAAVMKTGPMKWSGFVWDEIISVVHS